MRTVLASHTVRITPGVPATLDVEVVNTVGVIDGLTAVVYGLDPAWVSLIQPVLSLFPDSVGTLTLRFDVPRTCPAGESAITVRVQSTIDPDRAVEHLVGLVVDPVEAAEMEMRPSLVEAGSYAGMQAIIHNLGNVTTEFAVSALDPARGVECHVAPATVAVRPGETGQVAITAHGHRPWFASQREHTLQITAESPTLTLTSTARFIQRPRIPRGVLTALILAAIVTLWALIFLFAIRFVRGGSDPAKAVPESWKEGARSVPLANVAASVSGTVTASTTGEPLSRITVVALRKKGDAWEKTGSAATSEDGSYVLGGLLPGTYRLQAEAVGYTPVWYPGVTDEAQAGAVLVAPAAVLADQDLVIEGELADMTGSVTLPPGTPGGDTPAEITVSLVKDSPDQAEVPPVTLSTTDQFTIPDLPTPATYLVQIVREGFDTQLFQVTLAGGQDTTIDPGSLLASNGTISGIAVDGANQPLGGVKVVIRSGAVERTITTPTVGDKGAFLVEGLPTPGAYVLTFTLEGYSSATVALDLGAGESMPGVVGKLIGGDGSLQGIVRDGQGDPIGGVAVVVTGAKGQQQTATLTTGVGVTGEGSYSLTGLPVPGAYTVTFTKPGFQTTTIGVVFDAAGPRSGLDAVMLPAASTVSGTASLAGVGQAGYKVQISDGTTIREVYTAASPAGAFSFANVAPGSYTITVTGTGITPRVVRIDVVEGVDQTVIVQVVAAGP